MIERVEFHIKELENMKLYPKELFYIGNTELLQRRKISIVGSRKPTQYSKSQIGQLAKLLAQQGFVIVSGAAMGTDRIAHEMAGTLNTIGVAGTGLDKRYPAINKNLIEEIETNGLMLSQFPPHTESFPANFPKRNELVVALGEILIVSECELKSGTMHSINFALNMKKEIYVLPQRIGESEGTNYLLKKGLAKPIYDLKKFVEELLGTPMDTKEDPVLEYFQTTPTYDDAITQYPNETFEYELSGKIVIKNGLVVVT
jgi:DNA processing protein